MKAPPGIAPARFEQALRKWRGIVGADWVFTSAQDLDAYRDSYSPLYGEVTERVASAVVAPDSVEQVQEVLRVAHAARIPLYAISTGKNLTYGGSAPAYSGSVILDLKRMNRILEVSERNAFALVEPGVSYFDLYRHIRERGLKLWIDCPDPGWGSLVGNSLDHGAGYTSAPFRDHFEARCGMEVVLADGQLLRTGMGALPNSKTWQQFRYGMGPMVDGLFAQSNFGVVTKMGFWLMPQPECALLLTAEAGRHDDGPAFIDALAQLGYEGLITSQLFVESPVMGFPMGPELARLRADWSERRVPALEDYARRNGLVFWSAPFAMYGHEDVVRTQLAHIRRRIEQIPGARVRETACLRFPLADDQLAAAPDKARLGIPSLSYFVSRFAPGAPLFEGHIDFSPVVPLDGQTLREAQDLFDRICQEHGIAPLGGRVLLYHLRAACLIYAVPVGRDPQANARARAGFARLMEVAAARGWGEYRIHPAFMDKGIGYYNYNDGALLRFHERLKDAVDPHGILSAGRYGIWPRHLRKHV
ncbi:MAG: FAD-binding oxidoreductase [Proteobacteria bacterium]|nr:FAD-binding oxidoreductase [Pseudomonadota bacterium]